MPILAAWKQWKSSCAAVEQDVQRLICDTCREPADLATRIRPTRPDPVRVRQRVRPLLGRKAQRDVARNVADLGGDGGSVVVGGIHDRLLHRRELGCGCGSAHQEPAGGARIGGRARLHGADIDCRRVRIRRQQCVDGGLLLGRQLVVVIEDRADGQRAFDALGRWRRGVDAGERAVGQREQPEGRLQRTLAVGRDIAHGRLPRSVVGMSRRGRRRGRGGRSRPGRGITAAGRRGRRARGWPGRRGCGPNG